MNQNHKYLSNLTPLRGIAALLVGVYHFEFSVARFISPSQSLFFERCYLMVDLFFVMSGFIMLHVYGKSFYNSISKINLRKFFIARFARVYPLHFFALSALIVFAIKLFPTYPNEIYNPSAIVTNYLLLQSYNIHKTATWNIPSWSISAECLAYLFFPFLALLINKKKKIAIGVVCIFILLSYVSIIWFLPRKNIFSPEIPVPHNLDATYDYGFLRGLAGFSLGMMVYLLYQMDAVRNFFKKDVIALLACIFLSLLMHFSTNDGWCIFLFAAIVLSFACNENSFHKICNNRIAQYLGNISYSVYLMQIFLLIFFSKWIRTKIIINTADHNIKFSAGAMYCLFFLVALIAVSSLSYYIIELPCRKFINHKLAHRSFETENVSVSNEAQNK